MAVKERTFAVSGIDISVYMTRDAAKAVPFYRDVLGLTPSSEGSDGAEFELPDGSTFGLWNPGDMMPFMQGNGVMFAVSDPQAAVVAAREFGVKFEDAFETPVCTMAVGEDVDGNQVIFHKRK